MQPVSILVDDRERSRLRSPFLPVQSLKSGGRTCISTATGPDDGRSCIHADARTSAVLILNLSDGTRGTKAYRASCAKSCLPLPLLEEAAGSTVETRAVGAAREQIEHRALCL